MCKFVIGEVVKLKSGGCDMTVADIRSDGILTLVWTDKFDNVQTFGVYQDCVFSVEPSSVEPS